MIDMDEYRRNRQKLETTMEQEPPIREGLYHGLVQLKEWMVRVLDNGSLHASEKYDSWEEAPYCKKCGTEGIEGGDFEEEGVSAFLCQTCQRQLGGQS